MAPKVQRFREKLWWCVGNSPSGTPMFALARCIRSFERRERKVHHFAHADPLRSGVGSSQRDHVRQPLD